uniref:Uncharacterized protein n=1 Tax=viral metagenome TaxID=1070528 RepID=A0A6C0EPD8_9ZZZZ
MDKTNTVNSENILPNLKNNSFTIIFSILILFLIISTFLILYKVPITGGSSKSSGSSQEAAANVMIIVFFALLVIIVSITLLPNFKDLKNLFMQISNVTYVILYTIFLILFFRLVPSDIINNYANYILPITIFFTGLSFYKSYKTDYITDFNVNYERIKTIILFLCLITIFIVYYVSDPGGFIQKNFGYSLLLTILLSVFAFLYLIITLTLPGMTTFSGNSSNNTTSSFLENISKFYVWGSILFIIFLIGITVAISTYPGGFFSDKTTSTSVMILLLITCIFWSTILSVHLFPEFSNKSLNITKITLFKKSLLMLLGVVISGLIIYWIVYNIQNLSGQSSILSLILNILLVVVVLALIYRTMNVKLPSNNSKKNGFFDLITSFVFYIPCIFNDVFSSILHFASGQYNSTNMTSIIMLFVAILLVLAYLAIPYLFNAVNLQGGKLLVNKPVYTNFLYPLGTYAELNGSDQFDYQYAISFWIFIDSSPPNTNASYSKFTSLLNFGNKPNVLYNAEKNTLIITMDKSDVKDSIVNENQNNNKLIDLDENGNTILYKNSKFLLQKWNNIIINYNGGVLDVFLNGELVKSNIGVIPYYKLDNLTIGEDNGINGGICNVVYFKKPLTYNNIYYLYNMVKTRTPPVIDDSNVTIVKNNIDTLQSSANNDKNKL